MKLRFIVAKVEKCQCGLIHLELESQERKMPVPRGEPIVLPMGSPPEVAEGMQYAISTIQMLQAEAIQHHSILVLSFEEYEGLKRPTVGDPIEIEVNR